MVQGVIAVHAGPPTMCQCFSRDGVVKHRVPTVYWGDVINAGPNRLSRVYWGGVVERGALDTSESAVPGGRGRVVGARDSKSMRD